MVISGSGRPRWGEIWAFCDSATTVKVHRFVGRRNGQNRFWGDGNSGADDLVDDALLIGRVDAIETPDGSWRAVTPRRQMLDGCVVGARRLPRRIAYRGWYGLRALVRRARR